MDNSFSETDYIDAQEAFSKWQGKIQETVDEYRLRQRKNELRALVRTVIKNELEENDRKIVKLKWYENRSVSEIAEILKIDKSTVSRRIQRINEIIYDKLKYALDYRYGKNYSKKSELLIKSGEALTCRINPLSISERLTALREKQCFSFNEAAEELGLSAKRLSEIEKQSETITIEELKKLCIFYKCTSDYLLFGSVKERIGANEKNFS